MPAIKVIFFDLGDTLVRISTKEWVPGARAVLADLAAAGIKLGIISNTGGLTRAQLLELLPSDFDFAMFQASLVFISSEQGVEKPNAEIFLRAVQASGVSAPECLYCSESLVETLAAQQVGMRAARIQDPQQADIGSLPVALRRLGMLP